MILTWLKPPTWGWLQRLFVLFVLTSYTHKAQKACKIGIGVQKQAMAGFLKKWDQASQATKYDNFWAKMRDCALPHFPLPTRGGGGG